KTLRTLPVQLLKELRTIEEIQHCGGVLAQNTGARAVQSHGCGEYSQVFVRQMFQTAASGTFPIHSSTVEPSERRRHEDADGVGAGVGTGRLGGVVDADGVPLRRGVTAVDGELLCSGVGDALVVVRLVVLDG